MFVFQMYMGVVSESCVIYERVFYLHKIPVHTNLSFLLFENIISKDSFKCLTKIITIFPVPHQQPEAPFERPLFSAVHRMPTPHPSDSQSPLAPSTPFSSHPSESLLLSPSHQPVLSHPSPQAPSTPQAMHLSPHYIHPTQHLSQNAQQTANAGNTSAAPQLPQISISDTDLPPPTTEEVEVIECTGGRPARAHDSISPRLRHRTSPNLAGTSGSASGPVLYPR